ncbi:MAG: ArsC family reductase [Oceanicoccus sp.]
MTTVTLYGIKNCDTVKKARQWLDTHEITYHFHDFREQDISSDQVKLWIQQLGWDKVVNKRSTTWKQLGDAARDNMDEGSAVAAILSNPTLVKRPLLDIDGQYSVGFSPEGYQTTF